MKVRDFLLERYFAKYEFTTEHMLSASDCEALSVTELLQGADGEVMDLWNGLRLSYTESRGHPLLLREIAERESMPPENVLVMNPEEGVFLTLNALLDASDHVIVLSPCYQSLYEIPKSIGCEVTRWYLKKEGGEWRLDLRFLEESIRENTRLLVVNFPHNPTGFTPSREQMDEIAELSARHGFFVFSDEMYRGLELSTATLPSASSYIRRSASLGGLSKACGLPGLRIGWVSSHDSWLLNRIATLKDYTSICASAPSEILAIAALRRYDELTGRCRGIVRGNLELARTFFKERDGLFEWYEPSGGSTAFPRLLGEPARDFCDRAVAEHGLLILPDSVFDVDWNHFRIGLGRSSFPEALSVLGRMLSDRAQGRWTGA